MTIRSFTLFLLLVCFAVTSATAAVVVPPVAAEQTTTEADALAAVDEYKASLKAMSAKERRQLKRAQKQEMKQALRDHKGSGKDADTNTLLLVILAILLPPVAVLVHQGELNSKFWIALLLTLLFYLPGLIYALLVIFGNA